MNNNLIGKIVCGYRIVSEVGEGGMGKVYLAESAFLTEYKQQVAIKTLTGYASSERQAALLRELFIREANLQVQFKHPHIVSVIQFAVEGDQLFLILEYMPGYQHKGRRISNVAEMIAYETGPIPHKRALKIFVHALDAMQYAHNFKYRWEGEERIGIVHRDIKPANLLMMDAETVKVSDFGIVKVQQSKTVTQKLTPGTSAYMSPEAILGPQQFGLAELDARSDIYSLGITLYEMLAGRLPFAPDPDTSPDISMRRKHVNEAPPPPSAYYPGIPKQLDELVLRALAKRPDQRYQSAEEFKNAILTLEDSLRLGLVDKRSTRAFEKAVAAAAPTERLEVAPTGAATVALTDSGKFTTPGTAVRGTAVTKPASAGGSKLIWAMGALVVVLALAIAAIFLRPSSETTTTTSGSGKNPPAPVTVPGDMVLIEGGSFLMGRNLTDAEKEFAINSQAGPIKIFSYDYPAHPEEVKTFLLAKTEVSNDEYAEFVKSGQAPPSHWQGSSPPANAGSLPVTHVTYRDAAKYCTWLTTKRNDGFIYRLPSEKEWEFAARGKDAGTPNGKMNLYTWGEQWIDGTANTKESRLERPRNVDNDVRPTSTGLMNLSGNVFEWTATDFVHYPGSDRQTPREAGYQGTYQVVRGGAFDYPKEYAMTTTRVWAKPEDKGPSLGFRCAADPKRTSSAKAKSVARQIGNQTASFWSRKR